MRAPGKTLRPIRSTLIATCCGLALGWTIAITGAEHGYDMDLAITGTVAIGATCLLAAVLLGIRDATLTTMFGDPNDMSYAEIRESHRQRETAKAVMTLLAVIVDVGCLVLLLLVGIHHLWTGHDWRP